MGVNSQIQPLIIKASGCFIPVLMGMLAFWPSGCTPKIQGVELPVDSLEAFSPAGITPLEQQWWTVFEDPELNRLIDSALSDNFNLANLWHQFQAAQAVKKREKSFLWPDIQASVQSGISRPEPDFAGGENIQVGISAAYEVDLWGSIRSGYQAERFRAEASLADYQTGAISLSAEIALTWFELVATVNQLNLVNQQISTNENIIKLIRNRFGSGQIRAVDILRQTQLLESTRDQEVVLQTNKALLENQLAVLLGKQPQVELSFQFDSLPNLPPIPDTGLPLTLIQRRPDIRRAYNLLLAADRDMAAAITNQYPRLSFRLASQFRSNDYTNLLQESAYSLAGNLVAPLLFGGRLRAEVDRTEAIKFQRLYDYGQTALIAFREVEDALIQENKLYERFNIVNKRLDLAQKTNDQLRIEFLNGFSNYLDVLISLEQEQQLRRDLISAKFSLVENRIFLYRALAGNFETIRETNP